MAIGCDWIDLTIRADLDMPRLRRQMISLDTGELVSSAVVPTTTRLTDDGETPESGSTRIIIRPGRVDGEIYVSGNIGRWARTDNIWQPPVRYCLDVLLPRILRVAGSTRWDHDTITLHRVDICEVIGVDPGQSYRYISWAAGQRLGRLQPTVEAHGVYWGMRSTHRTIKLYDKLQDLRRRGKHDLAQQLLQTYGMDIVRREIQLRRSLATWAIDRYHDWDVYGSVEMTIMSCQMRDLDRGGISYEDAIADISTRRGRTLAGYLSMWRDGVDLARELPDRTYRRIRAQVRRETGIDISLPPDVTRLPTRTIEVRPQHLDIPVWYPAPWRSTGC